MRAAVQWSAGGTFEVSDVDLAEPGPGEVVVRVRAAGVCATDLSLTTAFGQPTPVVLGHEGAGTVERLGAGVTDLTVGEHVLVLWVAPCGTCTPCLRGDEHLCAGRRSTGSGPATARLSIHGEVVHQGMNTATFAELTVLPRAAVLPIPDDVPFPVAAMFGCAVPTGVGAALRSARVRPGDSVAVIGAGAVGLNAVLGAQVAGAARLIAVDPTERRRETARELGATESMTPAEFAERGRDLDVVIDAVGHPPTILDAWRAVRRGGTVTVVGAGRKDETVPLSAYELFHDDKRITGSWHGGMSMRRDLGLLVDLWRAGRLPVERLVAGTADLTEINQVVADQQQGRVVRTVLTPT
ncbi:MULTISPECIES: alcohol dehydrogenase catalytic domain-containing protein [Pseudonocardia]|jgi:S-(hydroxymethyl)glutathione dehydrogenase/alcohol dehydrogenase|uniref:Alcohol dehydrogenase n=2 Tax=Pseudonocardia TaxID=1847 RepID=A0ABQ0RZ04_9PSEU|nr:MULTISPECIES: alcohol dehydrogenase catalytic domain-containing protein [Pseudonocardia]OSY37102.1 putative alcohol dehydrogenase D [Pseudonocardia autotrophica]TDN72074.1 S-(hydroxymethyl)glutathione dehydrogenase/alcohol dehydrogenase [Pseudonocardia autotrophica]BBG02772.1 alcohol dehydrogenase [Pseudonocardia autotrophica]GEC25895.1 alcohol dehydrogenase [Pseudonocardia saturnea]